MWIFEYFLVCFTMLSNFRPPHPRAFRLCAHVVKMSRKLPDKRHKPLIFTPRLGLDSENVLTSRKICAISLDVHAVDFEKIQI